MGKVTKTVCAGGLPVGKVAKLLSNGFISLPWALWPRIPLTVETVLAPRRRPKRRLLRAILPRMTPTTRTRCLMAMAACATLVSSAPVAAQEVRITGPISGACVAVLARYCMPARVEWAYWISGGILTDIGPRGVERVLPRVGLGAEMTMGVWSPSMAPETFTRPWRENRPELRLGAWAGAETRSTGALVEGGLTAHLGTTDDHLNTLFYQAPKGMFDLRVGAGYGAFSGGRSPHLALSIAWGYRTVFERHTWGGLCDPVPEPPAIADATLVRLVATLRRPLDFPAWEAVLAVELSPTAVLVPWRNQPERRRFRPD